MSCRNCGVAGTDYCEACSGWLGFDQVEFRIYQEESWLGGPVATLSWWDRRVCWDQGIQIEFANYQLATKFLVALQGRWVEYNEAANRQGQSEYSGPDYEALSDWLTDLEESVVGG